MSAPHTQRRPYLHRTRPDVRRTEHQECTSTYDLITRTQMYDTHLRAKARIQSYLTVGLWSLRRREVSHALRKVPVHAKA